MENYTLVRPEHLNQYGRLFGGVLLKWVDEFAWMAASLEYPGIRLVTIGMNRVEFREQVESGSILKFRTDFKSHGNTSVTYTVEVTAQNAAPCESCVVFSTQVTFVRIDEEGGKCSLPARGAVPDSERIHASI